MANKNEWTLLALQENISFYAARASSGSISSLLLANCQLQLSLTLVLELYELGALPLDSAKEPSNFIEFSF